MEKLKPFIAAAFLVGMLIVGFIFFSYLIIVSAIIIGGVFFIVWIKRLLHPNAFKSVTKSTKKNTGRTIDYDELNHDQ